MKETGTVKFFNEAKGFGFIKNEEGKDFFVHISVLNAGATLNEGLWLVCRTSAFATMS